MPLTGTTIVVEYPTLSLGLALLEIVMKTSNIARCIAVLSAAAGCGGAIPSTAPLPHYMPDDASKIASRSGRDVDVVLARVCEGSGEVDPDVLQTLAITGRGEACARVAAQAQRLEDQRAAGLFLHSCELGFLPGCDGALRLSSSWAREVERTKAKASTTTTRTPSPEASSTEKEPDPKQLLGACGRLARLYTESQNSAVTPAQLLKPVESCLTAAAGVSVAKRGEMVDCVQKSPELRCSDAIGGSQIFAGTVSSPEASTEVDLKGVEKQLERAETACTNVATCKTLCEKGDTFTCVVLGGRYWDGKGTPRDIRKGLETWRAACADHNPFSCEMVRRTETVTAASCDAADCEQLCKAKSETACARREALLSPDLSPELVSIGSSLTQAMAFERRLRAETDVPAAKKAATLANFKNKMPRMRSAFCVAKKAFVTGHGAPAYGRSSASFCEDHAPPLFYRGETFATDKICREAFATQCP